MKTYKIVKTFTQVVTEEQNVALLDYIGQKVKTLREDAKLHQRELADLAGTSQANVSRLEAWDSTQEKYKDSTMAINIIEAIADALDVHISDLLPPKQDDTQS